MAHTHGKHYLGHEKEPPAMHPKRGGRRPLVHSHSARAKRSIKPSGRKR